MKFDFSIARILLPINLSTLLLDGQEIAVYLVKVIKQIIFYKKVNIEYLRPQRHKIFLFYHEFKRFI